jgi:hypothetical protein
MDLIDIAVAVSQGPSSSGGGYSPPASGIPESDLSQGVKDALNKARSVDEIKPLIPTQASATNKLVDTDTMTTIVLRMAAKYVTATAAADTQFISLDALKSGPWFHQGQPYTPDEHDFAIFINTDNSVWWASFDGVLWGAQFKINDTPFTPAQLAALNSAITAGLVEKLNGLPNSDKLADLFDEKIDKTEKGVANGVASLDNAGKVPASQLPADPWKKVQIA